MYQHFPFQCPPKLTQIGIFGIKRYHLATLIPSLSQLNCIRREIAGFSTKPALPNGMLFYTKAVSYFLFLFIGLSRSRFHRDTKKELQS
jgi:hypothetical protein